MTRTNKLLAATALAFALSTAAFGATTWALWPSGDAERDCLAQADRSGFAVEVCEPLQPGWRPADSDACDQVRWHATDRDERRLSPTDLNRDGRIDCSSDRELGA